MQVTTQNMSLATPLWNPQICRKIFDHDGNSDNTGDYSTC